MMKVIKSLGIIAAVAALAVGGTAAYFSDTEISVGNTMTAGTIDLKIDSMGTIFNGTLIPGTSWFPPRDLTNEKFWDISDIKPGGTVQTTISLHLKDNPAWACLLVKNKQDDDNGLNEPETQAGDTTGGNDEGELGKNIHVLGWRDNGNGVHDPSEPFLVNSFFDVFYEMPITDSTTGTPPLDPLIPIELVQMELCGGAHIVNPVSGAISCDGSVMGNEVQSDSLKADIALYAEQSGSNPNFRCSDLRSLPNSH